MIIFNPKKLAQVVRALVLVAFPSSLRFKSPWVQTVPQMAIMTKEQH